MNERQLILVDALDRPLGLGEKQEVHEKGLLHRAFSLFLLNQEGKLLLQRRALNKYHSPGLWTNSCCSHPVPNLTTEEFVSIRTKEELGVQADHLMEMGTFLYYRHFENGLREYELDHVFVGVTQSHVTVDPEEVMETDWVDPQWAMEDLRRNPDRYTAWYPTAFSVALPGILEFRERILTNMEHMH